MLCNRHVRLLAFEAGFKNIIIILILGFPVDSDCKESACNAKDSDSVPGLGRSPGEGNDQTLQYSGILQIKHRGAEK